MRWAIGSGISVYVWTVWEISIKIATWVQPIWSPSVGVSALMKPSVTQKRKRRETIKEKSKQNEQLLTWKKKTTPSVASFTKRSKNILVFLIKIILRKYSEHENHWTSYTSLPCRTPFILAQRSMKWILKFLSYSK